MPNFARPLKSRAKATRLKAVSGVCLTFGVQNLNPQQEKALAEFLSGSDVFVNLATTFVGFFNDHSHANQANLHASEQIISAGIFVGAMAERILKPIKLITLQNHKVY